MYIYVCPMCIHACTCTYTGTCIYAYMYIHMYRYIRIYMHMYAYVHMYARMCKRTGYSPSYTCVSTTFSRPVGLYNVGGACLTPHTHAYTTNIARS